MALELYGLTCEYQEEALGVARQEAVFGWKLRSAQTGAVQSAYRIVVRDEWGSIVRDSGKVYSNRQYGVTVLGAALEAMTRYFFSVTVWDGEDIPSQAAESFFVTGVFRVHQWRGQWFRVWHHGMVHFYRHTFEVPHPERVRYAYAFIASRGEKMNSNVTYLNGERPGDSLHFPGAAEYFRAFYTCVDVKDRLRAGTNVFGLIATMTSSLVLRIVCEDGSEQWVVSQRDTWRGAMQGPYVKLGYSEADQRGKDPALGEILGMFHKPSEQWVKIQVLERLPPGSRPT